MPDRVGAGYIEDVTRRILHLAAATVATLVTAPAVAEESAGGWPDVIGVRGGADARASQLVRFVVGADQPRVLAAFSHAAGWLPPVAVDEWQQTAVAAIVAPGARHGAPAALMAVDLATGARERLAERVPPRQTALFAGGSIAFVEWLGVRSDPRAAMDVERLRLVRYDRTTGAKVGLLGYEGYLLWPLAVVTEQIVLLRAGPEGSALVAVSADDGKAREIVSFGPTAVRDFSLTPDAEAITYQRRLSAGRYAVERVRLSDGEVRRLWRSELPWLAPLPTSAGVLLSLSPTPHSGALGLLGSKGLARLSALAPGAPIPIAARDGWGVVRYQSADAQRYLLMRLDESPPRTRKIDVGAERLESVTIVSEGRR